MDEKTLRKITSPCISVCKLNPRQFCIGCKRHEDEIRSWMSLSFEMRQAIIQDLEDRDIE
ncbi:MAG: DUF1289 domain-containing protein [Gammaproteobacteria bacterium]|jgi:predicted Fe-S protein YdhL (DUF1289 family)|nr:DUF1289 domain-containing protein [Gammaproteobacteria bacterium]